MKESVRIKRELKRKEQGRKTFRALLWIAVAGIVFCLVECLFSGYDFADTIIVGTMLTFFIVLLLFALIGRQIYGK